MSQTEVAFLDVRVFKGSRWLSTRCLDTTIHHKITAQKQVLAITSLHPPSTHLAWPQSMVHRIKSLCNSQSSQRGELDHLKRMLSERCGTKHVQLVLGDQRQRVPRTLLHDTTQRLVSRLIIPYHREWEIGAIHATLRKVLERNSNILQATLNRPLSVTVVHALQRRHLDILLWKMAERSWLEAGDGGG